MSAMCLQGDPRALHWHPQASKSIEKAWGETHFQNSQNLVFARYLGMVVCKRSFKWTPSLRQGYEWRATELGVTEEILLEQMHK